MLELWIFGILELWILGNCEFWKFRILDSFFTDRLVLGGG